MGVTTEAGYVAQLVVCSTRFCVPFLTPRKPGMAVRACNPVWHGILPPGKAGWASFFPSLLFFFFLLSLDYFLSWVPLAGLAGTLLDVHA